jgi:hypothetical protein
MHEYSVKMKPGWDPALVIRFAYAPLDNDHLAYLMRIPPRLIDNRELNWRIRCEQTADLTPKEAVDYDQFDFNIAGAKDTLFQPTDLPEDRP